MIKRYFKYFIQSFYFLSKKQDKKKLSLVFKGNNWYKNKEKPIAILFNFNPWKRKFLYSYLSDYRVAFVLGHASWRRIKNDLIDNISPHTELLFVTWGQKPLPIGAYLYIKLFNRNIRIMSIEDGFIRSIGAGVLHTRPASLCMDKMGIYFNAHKSSMLENILNTYDFKDDSKLMSRARLAIDIITNAQLTKYYNIQEKDQYEHFKKTENYSILVIGQVEDDASIQFGKSKIILNTDLVRQAHKDYPNANIYFKPHPDYLANTRKSISNIEKIKDICAILPENINLNEIFKKVDHVYTITSLLGFEALIRGIKVTTFGAPFYSNWGLTDDRSKIKRRKRILTLTELVAATYFLYPKYVYLSSNEETTFEETISYFIFETLKEVNIFKLHLESSLYKNSVSNFDYLSTPLKVLKYLNSTKTYSEANSLELFKIINYDFKLVHYEQISYALIETSNYDMLVEYSNQCIEYLKKNIDNIIENDTALLNSFLYSLSISMKHSAGRVIVPLPNLIDEIFSIPKNDDNIDDIYMNYIVCCSSNLQYFIIDKFILALEHIEYMPQPLSRHRTLDDILETNRRHYGSIKTYKRITNILSGKPTRSERYSEKRHQLIERTSQLYLSELNSKYSHIHEIILNEILFNILLGNKNRVESLLLSLYKRHENLKLFIHKFDRVNDFFIIVESLINYSKFNQAEKLLETLSDINENDWYHYLILLLYVKQNQGDKYYLYLSNLSQESKDNEKISILTAQQLRKDGYTDASKRLYRALHLTAKTTARKLLLSEEIAKLSFLQETSQILNSVPQPKLPKGIAFLSLQTCFDSLALITPSLVELKKKGYAVINLTGGMTNDVPTGLEFIDQFSGIIPLDNSLINKNGTYFNSWNIDWENRKVISEDINFYQGFYERISTFLRRFNVDINMPLAYKTFEYNLVRADIALHVCKRIYSEIVLSRNIPVTFISGNTHITPYSIFRDFAISKNHDKLGFINFNVAYESYFSNVGSKFANTMAVTDMTLYPNLRAPFLARKDQFDKWYEKHKNDKEYLEKATSQINVNRVGSTTNKKELELIETLKQARTEGKKILCAFGKVPVDLNVPIDGGNAHTDMSDWITNTVEVCNDIDDIILLIKPHPHELKPEISLDLIDSFFDLIKIKPSTNIILLGHKDINNFALAPFLDLGILYNGSTSLELVAQGIPVILTSYFGKHDYPIELIYPHDRKNYKTFIQSLKYPKPSNDLRKKAAFLISYMGTSEISTINSYSFRRLTNDKIGVPSWKKDLIDDFLEHGDIEMKNIAEKMIAKFEKESK